MKTHDFVEMETQQIEFEERCQRYWRMSTAPNMTDPPKPGIYEGVPFEEYLLWDAISNSRLNMAAKSLAHFKHGASIEPTPSMQLGSLVHCGVLEPIALAERYVVMPDFHLDEANCRDDGQQSKSKTTLYVRRQVELFETANQHRQIIERESYAKMLGACRSLAADPEASRRFNALGPFEVSYVWEDDETGLLCKARADKLTDHDCIDYKTSGPCLLEFEKSIRQYGYHRQGAHYLDGLRILGHSASDFVITAQEMSDFYPCRTAPIHPDSIACGEYQRRKLLRLIADAMQTDQWPSYPNPDYWQLEEWYLNRESEPVEFEVEGRKVTL